MKLFSAAIVLTALFSTYSANAQVKKDSLSIVNKDTISNKNISFEKGKAYILGGISVTGLKKFSEETVRVFTGLRYGQTIKLPGDKLTSAIKKLYESKQFSDVDVYLDRIDGETVYLKLEVQELPQLNQVKISVNKKHPINWMLFVFIKYFMCYAFSGFPSQAAFAASFTASEYVGCP